MDITIVLDQGAECQPDSRLARGFGHPIFPHGPCVGPHQVWVAPPVVAQARYHGFPCRCMWGHWTPRSTECTDFYEILIATFMCDCGWSSNDQVYTTNARRIRKQSVCPRSRTDMTAGVFDVAA